MSTTIKHEYRPLTTKQRQYLTMRLAHKGFRRTGANESDETFDQWRHREAMEATKNANSEGVTISTAQQKHFNALKLHFAKLAGIATLEDAGDEAQELRQVTHSISVLCKELGYESGYLKGICKNILHDITWHTAADGRKIQAALRYAKTRKKKQAALAAKTEVVVSP